MMSRESKQMDDLNHKIILIINGTNHGPYSISKVQKLLSSGKITLETLCWQKDSKAPKPLRKLAEFSDQQTSLSQGHWVLPNNQKQPRQLKFRDESNKVPRRPPMQNNGNKSPYIRNIAVDLVLSVITLGIFNLFVQYHQVRAVNAMLGENKYSFRKWFIFTFISCGLYNIYHEYVKSIDISIVSGSDRQISGLIAILSSLFGLFFINDAIQQKEINEYFGGQDL